jgi:hypothetical protein
LEGIAEQLLEAEVIEGEQLREMLAKVHLSDAVNETVAV